MVQNRRVLARVAPETFSDLSVASIAETPTAILEALRDTADLSFGEPLIVMLSPGPGNAFYTEHSFLARRMGIPLVQGGDLLVLDDHVYLKTIGGLERVHVIYNRVWPTTCSTRWCWSAARSSACRGWCIACARKPSRWSTPWAASWPTTARCSPSRRKIIRFYLGEAPILPTMQTYWCGDRDQCELVLSNLADFRILPRVGDQLFGNKRGLVPTAAEESALRAGNPQAHAAPFHRATHRAGRADALLRGRPQGRAAAGPPRFRPAQGRRHRGVPRRADPRRARGQPVHGGGAGRRQQGYLGAQRRRRADHAPVALAAPARDVHPRRGA